MKDVRSDLADMAYTICDSHVHVFDPARFAYSDQRRFTPGVATVIDLQRNQNSLSVSNTVLVQPSVYGHDHRCLLDALYQLNGRARGIAVLGPDMKTAAIDQMISLGVCGQRVNLAVDDINQPDLAKHRLEEAFRRAPAAWHIQIHTRLATLFELVPQLLASKRKIVVDHFGLPAMSSNDLPEGWNKFIGLLRSEDIYVKLSAPYLISRSGGDFSDLDAVVDSLVDNVPEKIVWGSNWPHTQGTSRNSSNPFETVEPFRLVNDLKILDRLKERLPMAIARKVFQENPQKIYQFSSQLT